MVVIVLMTYPNVGTFAANSVKGTSKKLSFPQTHSVGTLVLLPPFKTIKTAGAQISGAKGDVTVEIPPGNLLIFEPNQYAFLHPDLLDTISVSAVDALKVAFLSMDPSEDSLCDALLKHLSRFSNLSMLAVSDSDATDSGVTSALTQVHVKDLNVTHSKVRGAFLKQTAGLDSVCFMDLSWCPIAANNFKFLSNAKHLTRLAVAKTDLDQSKLTTISECINLTDLDISDNAKINDACVQTILRLKNLKSLKLNGTTITLEGLKLLAPLKLKRIWLPRSVYSEQDKTLLTKLFGTALQSSADNNKRMREMEQILAPTTKMQGLK